jgi:hypothetical protein
MKTIYPGFWWWLALLWAPCALLILLIDANPHSGFGAVTDSPRKHFFLILGLAWAASFFGMQRMKKRHRDEFEELTKSPAEQIPGRFLRYLFTFRFKRLNDAVVLACFLLVLALMAFDLALLVVA